MKGIQADAAQIVRKCGNLRLVSHRRMGIWNAGRRFQGVLSTLTMNVKQPLRLGIIRLKC